MLGFIEDMSKLTGLPLDIINNGYQIFNFGGRAIYIDNYKSIMTYNQNNICLKLKKGVVNIFGSNLYIKDLNLSQIIINGNIEKVEVN